MLNDFDKRQMNEILGTQPPSPEDDAHSKPNNAETAVETVDDEEYARNREKILEFNKRKQDDTDTAEIARMMQYIDGLEEQ